MEESHQKNDSADEQRSVEDLQNPEKSAGKPTQAEEFTEGEADEHLLLEIIRVRSQEKQKRALALWKLPNEQLQDFFAAYQMFDGLGITIRDLLKSSSLKLVKNDNRVYFGEIKDQKKHGVGIAIYQDGKVYEGQFVNNQKHGYGYEIYPNCNVYVGDFEKNKKHGTGSFYWFTVSSMSPSNHEQIEYYRGQWWGGLPSGKGFHRQANGDVCQGMFKNGLKHGQGMEKFANGDSYKGQYVNGLPEGHGEYTWADGSNYRGDFKQGVRNGFGIWKQNNSKNCQSYRGHYLLDRKSGYGVYIWENGDYYKGEFFQDMRHGMGQLYRAGDMVYKGMWENGKEAPHLKYIKRKNPHQQFDYRQNISIVELTEGDISKNGKSQDKSKSNQRYDVANKFANSRVEPQLEATLKKKQNGPHSGNIGRIPSNMQTLGHHHHGRVGHRNCIPVQNFGLPRHMYKMNRDH